jgi:N6-adenosine-specific RNA methylase IME4
MTWDEILIWAASMREYLLDDAWGFMWMPRAHLLALHPVEYQMQTPAGEMWGASIPTPLSWAIARAMGFTGYSTCFDWTKTDEEHPDDIGMGILVRDQDELLLLFKKGRGCAKPARNEIFGSNHRERSKPLGHSRKPQHYREMIAKMVGDGVTVLECFVRHDERFPMPPGWDSMGNESQPKQQAAE